MQQPFQMMGVLDMPCHLRRSRPQQRLHRIEQGRFHDGLVRAGIQPALVADDARVVRVREQFVERVLPQRLGGALRRRHRDQPACGEVAEQAGDGGLAFGVVLECPGDERCPFGIDLDCAYLAARVVGAADVEVPDGCAHRGAALCDLLRQSLGDFGGEVAAVELGDGGYDAVDEHPGGCLVDALGGRDEGHARVDEGFVDFHVVGAVAGEPVELVHDAERDSGGGDERQHLLQPVTIRRPCGLARVHELPHNPCAEFACLAVVRLALGGDGESFVSAAALGLLTSGHAQVGHGQQHRLVGCLRVERGESGSRGGHAVLLRRCSSSGSSCSSTLPRASDRRLRVAGAGRS